MREGAPKDLMWIRPDGEEMTERDWQNAENTTLGALVNGDATDDTDERGRPIRDDTMLLLTNAGDAGVRFTLPQIAATGRWAELIDTSRETLRAIDTRLGRARAAFAHAAAVWGGAAAGGGRPIAGSIVAEVRGTVTDER